MLRNVYLRQAEDILDVTNADRLLAQKVQNPQASEIGDSGLALANTCARGAKGVPKRLVTR